MSVFQFQLDTYLMLFLGMDTCPWNYAGISFQVLPGAGWGYRATRQDQGGLVQYVWLERSPAVFKTQDVSSVYKTGIQHEAELDFQSLSFRFQVGIATAIFIGDWHTTQVSFIWQAAEIEKANLEQASMASMAGWHGTGSSK